MSNKLAKARKRSQWNIDEETNKEERRQYMRERIKFYLENSKAPAIPGSSVLFQNIVKTIVIPGDPANPLTVLGTKPVIFI